MGKGISLEELNRRGRLEKVAPKLRHSPQPVAWNSIRELGEHLNRFEREHFRPREQNQDLQSKPSEGILQQVFWLSGFFFLMNLFFVFGTFVIIYQTALFFFDYEITYFGYAPLVWFAVFNLGLLVWLDL
tara:strand:+ start:1131 stop:1520 length:390 start_codon:yes stop_codon:yes gene_type:complete